MQLAGRIYKEVIPCLPSEEKWAMASQLRRASTSIPANVAEGYGRFYYQEGIRFCYIARGSLEETWTLVTLAKDLEFLPKELFDSIKSDVTELRRIIGGYIAYLKKSKPGQHEPGIATRIKEDPDLYFAQENESHDG